MKTKLMLILNAMLLVSHGQINMLFMGGVSGGSQSLNPSSFGPLSAQNLSLLTNAFPGLIDQVKWLGLMPSTHGTITIDTTGSGFDTAVAVYSGSPTHGMSLLASNDDIGGGTNTSRVTFGASAGEPLSILLAAKIGQTISNPVINISSSTANTPPNISEISTYNTAEDSSQAPLSFTIGDWQTVASSLVLSYEILTPSPSLVGSTVTFGGSGMNRTVTVNPKPNGNGYMSVVVKVTDSGSPPLTSTSQFDVHVAPMNDRPVPPHITFTRLGPVAFSFTAADILQKCTDVDGDALTLVQFIPSMYSTLQQGSGGKITYSPNGSFTWSDSFYYVVSDGALSATNLVTVIVE